MHQTDQVGGGMVSYFAWLDHSESQRRRMTEVVAPLREKGTLDELGIGSVRDALSDMLFPGGSVLHTRARYLLLVPWLCRRVEQERVASRRAMAKLREYEIQLIAALVAGGESRGVIGVDARGRLKQTPSLASDSWRRRGAGPVTGTGQGNQGRCTRSMKTQ